PRSLPVPGASILTRSLVCPRGRSSTETRTTSRGSPKRPIPAADNHTDRPLDARGPASTDKPHEITTALRAAPRSALMPLYQFDDGGGAEGSALVLTFHRDNRMYEWTTPARLPIG